MGRVRFRRLRGRDLRGTLRLRDQVISSPLLSVTAAGGQASVRGSLDARQPDLLKVPQHGNAGAARAASVYLAFSLFAAHTIASAVLPPTETGRVGRSDFQLNGLFRNALGWLLLPRQQLWWRPT